MSEQPDQPDVPQPRPAVDQSDAQSVDTSAPTDQPKEASKRTQPVQASRPVKFDSELFKLLPAEDQLEAYKYHQDAQLLAELTPQEKRDYLHEAARREHRYQFANLVALPVVGLCGSLVAMIAEHAHHVSAPWDYVAGAGGVVSAGTLTYQVSKRRLEARRRKKKAELSAAATAAPDQSQPAGG